MFNKAKPARDAFAFSLGGMTAKSSFVIAPAIADDRINKIRDERLGRSQEDQPDTAREIENVLAYYFAPGRCRAA
ncbi:MAG: hypothetical protein KJO01_11990 [Gammaproteobacteria bacterium]|nr:hypothetical protein [Gammaproteobacteria bacterium]MBT8109883.1 hypothetical protein [Gammaproteobacteria bacterium]NND48540.1 hypothetical protein [Woeseiaceae bacterium]NNL44585.1 hypothetical protein [Woeseiaceae bacterium]